ncbi:polyprenol monophosphomannose synthase [Chitinophaga japonensis]|uniref:Dolichol-phosphate mannosyltransferase n=1 Tax=Chitinophaga japonensis TaxID=104662 RepID=A0A562T6R7_CHIJA|nr:polyprenol monophosphomannose synthase [Chitinophaga japonensis]TWI88690.1 dolichol-phosphate mannosyltransferase [Chitinophaga japonensis]
MEKLVIIPTYNEKDNIRKIIDAVFSLQHDFHVLIVDDGSPDGTGTIVKQLQEQHPGELFLEERSGKQGLGTAYIHGFKWALAQGYAYIFEMDADFSHNPKDLVRLYDACATGGGDVAVGSRYVRGGRTENWPWDRAILSYGASVYVRFVTWMPVKDATAGFVCYKRAVLEAINLDAIQFVGYAFQIEMKFTAWKLGFRIKEVSITFRDRREGYSKMSKGIIKEGILGVLKIQWQSLFRRYERRVSSRQS